MTRSPVKILSIIVPTYNMEALLPQCVESVLRTPSLAGVSSVNGDTSCLPMIKGTAHSV